MGLSSINLLGFGPGTLILFQTLLELHKESIFNRVNNVYLVGGIVELSEFKKNFYKLLKVVNGKIYLFYADTDPLITFYSTLFKINNSIGMNTINIEWLAELLMNDIESGFFYEAPIGDDDEESLRELYTHIYSEKSDLNEEEKKAVDPRNYRKEQIVHYLKQKLVLCNISKFARVFDAFGGYTLYVNEILNGV